MNASAKSSLRTAASVSAGEVACVTRYPSPFSSSRRASRTADWSSATRMRRFVDEVATLIAGQRISLNFAGSLSSSSRSSSGTGAKSSLR